MDLKKLFRVIPKRLTEGKSCVIFILERNVEQLGTTFNTGGGILDINECISEYLTSMQSTTYNILRPYGIKAEEINLVDLIQVSSACVCLVVLVNKHLKAEILLTCSHDISFHVSKIYEGEM